MLKSAGSKQAKKVLWLSLNFWLGDSAYERNIVHYWDPSDSFIYTFLI